MWRHTAYSRELDSEGDRSGPEDRATVVHLPIRTRPIDNPIGTSGDISIDSACREGNGASVNRHRDSQGLPVVREARRTGYVVKQLRAHEVVPTPPCH